MGKPIDDVDSKLEDARLIDGDRGDMTPPTPWSELTEVFLLSVGVDDLWWLFKELELEILRSSLVVGGLFAFEGWIAWPF